MGIVIDNIKANELLGVECLGVFTKKPPAKANTKFKQIGIILLKAYAAGKEKANYVKRSAIMLVACFDNK